MGSTCQCDRPPLDPTEYSTIQTQSLKKGDPSLTLLPLTYEIPPLYLEKLSQLPIIPPPMIPESFDPRFYQTPDRVIYQGSWDKNNKASGYGKLIYPRGFYEGSVRDFEARGHGRFITDLGEVYEGDFEGIKKLNGSFIMIDGTKILGSFIEGNIVNEGEEKWMDGTSYKGNYVNGEKNGLGKMIWLNKKGVISETYDGAFLNDMFHGKGMYKWMNKRSYDGEWKNGKMNGFGIFTWNDGRIYKGEFKDDLRNGLGEFKWPDGRIWKGTSIKGKKNGIGYLTDLGTIQVGEWKDDKRIRWLEKAEVDALEKTNHQ